MCLHAYSEATLIQNGQVKSYGVPFILLVMVLSNSRSFTPHTAQRDFRSHQINPLLPEFFFFLGGDIAYDRLHSLDTHRNFLWSFFEIEIQILAIRIQMKVRLSWVASRMSGERDKELYSEDQMIQQAQATVKFCTSVFFTELGSPIDC